MAEGDREYEFIDSKGRTHRFTSWMAAKYGASHEAYMHSATVEIVARPIGGGDVLAHYTVTPSDAETILDELEENPNMPAPNNPADEIGAAEEAVEAAATVVEEVAEEADVPEATEEHAESVYEETMRALADWAEETADQAEEVAEVAEEVAEEAAESGDYEEAAAAEEAAEVADAAQEAAEEAAAEAEHKADNPPENSHWFYRRWGSRVP